jgi:hypothetical protein
MSPNSPVNATLIVEAVNAYGTLRAKLAALTNPVAYVGSTYIHCAIRDLEFLIEDCNVGRLDQHVAPSLQIAIDALKAHADYKMGEIRG